MLYYIESVFRVKHIVFNDFFYPKFTIKMENSKRRLLKNQSHIVGPGEPLGSEVFFFFCKKFWKFLFLKKTALDHMWAI